VRNDCEERARIGYSVENVRIVSCQRSLPLHSGRPRVSALLPSTDAYCVHRGIVWIVWSPITRIDLFETAGFYARASCSVTARANQLRISDELTSRENLRDKNYFGTIMAAACLRLRVLACARLRDLIAPISCSSLQILMFT